MTRMVKESEIESALIEYFNLCGYFSFKNYDQALKIDGVYRKHKWSCRGIADISILTSLGVVYVEVKTPKGKQSVYQKRFEHKCNAVGITYVVCKSIGDGKKLIEKIKERERGIQNLQGP